MENSVFDSYKEYQFHELHECLPNEWEDLRTLISILSPRCQMSYEQLCEVLSAPSSHLYVVRRSNRIVACATLCIFYSPTGAKASIEDVVVHTDCQGIGLGKALMCFVMKCASQWAPLTLQLTSRPSREAANALYRKLGFNHKETNFYNLKVE